VAQVVTADRGGSLREDALGGDEEAFEALIGPLVEPAIRLAYSMLDDQMEAEDATQEAITRACRKLGQLRSGMPVHPWFLAIVVNECRNVRRTRWFRFVRTKPIVEPDSHQEPALENIDLARAISRLPDRDRQPLFLHFYLDLPIEEVAFALGISPAATKGRIYRACHRLRPSLLEEEI
jgi:RNA polymerase sigma-70 factor (ECF subfamily)